ncbi:MAG: hypothetical protein AMXMBFR13_02860 [Phycisphaerae bacterium]
MQDQSPALQSPAPEEQPPPASRKSRRPRTRRRESAPAPESGPADPNVKPDREFAGDADSVETGPDSATPASDAEPGSHAEANEATTDSGNPAARAGRRRGAGRKTAGAAGTLSSEASSDTRTPSTATDEAPESANIHLAAQDPENPEDGTFSETSEDTTPGEHPAEAATDIQALTGHEPGPNGDGAQDEDDEPLPPPSESAQQEITPEQIVEAILFSADTAMTLPKIVSILGVGSARDVRKYIESLNERYEKAGLSFRIEKIAGGYRMLSLPAYNTWLRRLHQSHQDSRLSQAALETLAVVAYKQPVVRAEVEAIRGVSAGEMLNRLRELGLIKIVGRAEDVGRPILYGTTKRFLEVFGLGSLEDLPAVEELKAPE